MARLFATPSRAVIRVLFCLVLFLAAPFALHAQDYIAVSARSFFYTALKSDGTAWTFAGGSIMAGYSFKTNCALELMGSGFSAIANGSHQILGLKSDGSLWALAVDRNHVHIGDGFSAISAGSGHSLGLKTDGTVWAWGDNAFGQLGDGTMVDSDIPVLVGEEFVAIATGGIHSLGLKASGSVWAWGDNRYSQVGDGSTEDRATPVQVGEGFAKIACTAVASFGIKPNGDLWAWGMNDGGQLGDGTTINRSVPTPVGEGFEMIGGNSCTWGVKTDGSLWGWGPNSAGQLGDGTTTTRLTPVRIGEGFISLGSGGGNNLYRQALFSVGVKADGSLWAWGDSDFGLGDGTSEGSLTPRMLDVGSQGRVYCVPHFPRSQDFDVGFAVSNPNDSAMDVDVQYFLATRPKPEAHESVSIPPHGHASFMSSLSPGLNGWARILATRPVQGMALAFGQNADPMFDMDFAPPSTRLLAPHVDTLQGWASYAMLANPGTSTARATLTFHPDAGLPIKSKTITISGLNSVQANIYDLAPRMKGSLEISSDQPIGGFVLYDGRSGGNNYVGGLSMVPLN